MRADRLISLLMLLQSRGRMSARSLAKELEVSERTIYRDIDALSAAGIPVYGEPGREGGFALLDDYRTSLTGLTDGEVRALFALSVPAPLADLGLNQALKTALLKLTATLSKTQRHGEENIRQRLYIDSTGWRQHEVAVPHLQTVYQAVREDRRLHIAYRMGPGYRIEQCVDAYGLVAKAGLWHLVFASSGRMRARQIADLLEARLAEENFKRQADFDLESFWESWRREQEKNASLFQVTVRVRPDFIPLLPYYFGNRIQERIDRAGPPDEQGQITLELAFGSLEAARDRILSFGRGVEVLSPRALRISIQDYAAQIVALYAGEGEQNS